MTLKVLSLEEWNSIALNAHRDCFSEERPPEVNTCDFALLITDENDQPIAYTTVIEMDNKTAYMQHGGAFTPIAGTTKVLKTYKMILAFLKQNYLRISTRIKNSHLAMLKLALNEGLIVNGIDHLEGDTFLNLSWSQK